VVTDMQLSSTRVIPVLPAEDIERACAFYRDKLGLAVDRWEAIPGYAMVRAGDGTQIMLYERERTRAEHTEAAFLVDDVQGTVDELRRRGVEFEDYDTPGMKTENGIATFSGGGQTMYAAWFKDSEGNIISIGQSPGEATVKAA
jgi:catechol 2,3-dioxygenase-like lactoylglutathione lyase family enzyme